MKGCSGHSDMGSAPALWWTQEGGQGSELYVIKCIISSKYPVRAKSNQEREYQSCVLHDSDQHTL